VCSDNDPFFSQRMPPLFPSHKSMLICVICG
jgi:hypothetical protein